MTVKILLEREFKEDPTWEDLMKIKEFRIGALRYKGYFHGETLIDSENHRKIIVISAWDNIDSWKEWENSEDRRNLAAELQRKLKHPPITRFFILGSV